jgi:hypothetical protein
MSAGERAIDDDPSRGVDVADVLAVRRGPGANCSSIGSALDVLFVTATVAGMILVSVTAALNQAARDKPDDDGGDDARTR